MSESDIIVIAYFFLLCPGEYTGFKSDKTPFCLKYTVFSCGHILFAATAIVRNLQSAKFFTLTFTTQKNGVRG